MLLQQFYQSPAPFCPPPGVGPGPGDAPVSTGVPVIDDATPTEGMEILCSDGTWDGTVPITYQYQWYQVEETGPPTPPVAGSPVPSVSGSTSRGAVLHATTGTWSGLPAPTFNYQWKRLPSTSVGGNSSNYATVVADVGSNMTCTVTAINTSGTASQDASNSIGPIVEPAPGASLVTDTGDVLLTPTGEELTT